MSKPKLSKDESEILDTLKLALERLLQMGAEDESNRLGKCPACEALRRAIKKMSKRVQ